MPKKELLTYTPDYSRTESWRERERLAMRAARFRCQICDAKHVQGNRLTFHHRTNNLFEIPSNLTVLCQRCRHLFLKSGRLADLSHMEASLGYEYDDENFSRFDRSTWLMVDRLTVHIAWAEDFGLQAGSDFCEHCGYIVLDFDTCDPFVMCRSCGRVSGADEIHDDDLDLKDVVRGKWMSKAAYREYLGSPEWKSRAEETKGRDGHRCLICNVGTSRKNPLNAHHRTYRRLKSEDREDLATLCQMCHGIFHEDQKRRKTSNSKRGS